MSAPRKSHRGATQSVRAVERAVEILVAVGERDMRLLELSSQVGLHRASVARLAETLVTSGILTRDSNLKYSLGPRLIWLAGHLLSRYRRAAEFLREPLRRLWDATRETVTVNVRVDLERLCVAELPSPQPIGYRAGVGTRVPLHAGATSKVLLAFLPDDERKNLLSRLTLGAVASRTVTDLDLLSEQLDHIREQGFAVSTSEHIPGGAAASVPVFDLTDRVVAAVSIHGPESRLTEPTLHEYATLLLREIRPLAVVLSDG